MHFVQTLRKVYKLEVQIYIYRFVFQQPLVKQRLQNGECVQHCVSISQVCLCTYETDKTNLTRIHRDVKLQFFARATFSSTSYCRFFQVTSITAVCIYVPVRALLALKVTGCYSLWSLYTRSICTNVIIFSCAVFHANKIIFSQVQHALLTTLA